MPAFSTVIMGLYPTVMHSSLSLALLQMERQQGKGTGCHNLGSHSGQEPQLQTLTHIHTPKRTGQSIINHQPTWMLACMKHRNSHKQGHAIKDTTEVVQERVNITFMRTLTWSALHEECQLQSCSSTVWQEEKVGVVEELETAEKWEEEKLPFVIFSAWQERQRSRDVWQDLSLRSKNVILPRSDPFRRGSQKASFYRSVPELAQSFNAAWEKLRS